MRDRISSAAGQLLGLGFHAAGRLGHRNASTTLNVYSHFLAETDREAANVLGRIFDDAGDDPPAEADGAV